MTSFPRPIKAVSDRRRVLLVDHKRSRAQVFSRARGHCEAPDCQRDARELHHCLRRRHVIGEPYCSLPETTVALCRAHHDGITRGIDPTLDALLAWQAVERMIVRYRDELGDVERLSDDGPFDLARRCERVLRGQG